MQLLRARLAHESSLTTCASVAVGLDYTLAMNTDSFNAQQIIHLETALAVNTHLLRN